MLWRSFKAFSLTSYDKQSMFRVAILDFPGSGERKWQTFLAKRKRHFPFRTTNYEHTLSTQLVCSSTQELCTQCVFVVRKGKCLFLFAKKLSHLLSPLPGKSKVATLYEKKQFVLKSINLMLSIFHEKEESFNDIINKKF